MTSTTKVYPSASPKKMIDECKAGSARTNMKCQTPGEEKKKLEVEFTFSSPIMGKESSSSSALPRSAQKKKAAAATTPEKVLSSSPFPKGTPGSTSTQQKTPIMEVKSACNATTSEVKLQVQLTSVKKPLSSTSGPTTEMIALTNYMDSLSLTSSLTEEGSDEQGRVVASIKATVVPDHVKQEHETSSSTPSCTTPQRRAWVTPVVSTPRIGWTWTVTEVAALRSQMARHGKGNWELVADHPHLAHRSLSQIKSKWYNLTKRKQSSTTTPKTENSGGGNTVQVEVVMSTPIKKEESWV